MTTACPEDRFGQNLLQVELESKSDDQSIYLSIYLSIYIQVYIPAFDLLPAASSLQQVVYSKEQALLLYVQVSIDGTAVVQL